MTDIVGTLCNVDLLPSLVADESCAAALAGTCAALRAACSAEELWRDLACRRWPALLSPGVALRPRHGWRLLFRERAKLSGWRSLCPLLDASLATVAAGAEGWQETLSNQLLRLWEASARVSPAEGRHFFFSSAACLQAEGREEARRWRARLAALLAGGAGGASTVGPARLMPLCEWARGLAAELDSFYDRSCVDVWPHLWAQRIAAILRGRSALELLASAVEGGASGPLSPCGSSPRAVALSLVARPPGDRRGSVRVRIVACPSDGAVAAAEAGGGVARSGAAARSGGHRLEPAEPAHGGLQPLPASVAAAPRHTPGALLVVHSSAVREARARLLGGAGAWCRGPAARMPARHASRTHPSLRPSRLGLPRYVTCMRHACHTRGGAGSAWMLDRKGREVLCCVASVRFE
eukprot:CAMPEP_0202754806 /NCGR_PEP_ID=MMETSP1388-20130828/14576_1 /ASSEMBLY_ACC=CAM_ASM_000864 /TAXON_ID=37098 /ORGANISM="Isochrysis sp, Strain CCMP1244" /LENGTH=408 /DNA_ID=CAMNT_0049422585 /DNA_START=118 /DNA_END=1340 /DNA_ORIENTATION=+